MICISLGLIAWSYRQDKQLLQIWIALSNVILKLYKFEVTEAVLKKVFMMLVNIGLIGGLGFLK